MRDSHRALRELLERRDELRDIPSMSAFLTVADHHPFLTTHFKARGSYRNNKITESVIDKIETKLRLIRGSRRRVQSVTR